MPTCQLFDTVASYKKHGLLLMTKIAATQMCSSQNIDENLKTAHALITTAATNGARLVVLPEMFAIMGDNTADKVLVKEKFGEGKIQHFLSEQAKINDIWIVGGSTPIACGNPNKVKAACLVFDNEGSFIDRYDKIHLFDVTLSQQEKYNESDTTEPGDHLTIIETPFGKLGLAICYDVRFPELFRCLFNRGAEIIALPSAFTVPTGEAHFELLTRSRAIENFCYLIAACQGGNHANGRKTFGHSMIIDPWGSIIAKMDGTETGIIYSDIDLRKVQKARQAIPIAQHQKIYFDTSRLK